VIRIAALVAIAIAAQPAARAGDEPMPSGGLRDGEHNYQVVIAPGWRPLEAPEGTLIAYQSGAMHLAITRVDVGRVGKRAQTRMVDEIERGVEQATRGYRRVKRQVVMNGIVPVMDLWYESGERLTLSRFLLFRRHTMVLSVGLDRGAPRAARRAAESMIQSFVPFVP
jgi:hypothetical protein